MNTTTFYFCKRTLSKVLPVLTAAALLTLGTGCAFLTPAKNESHHYLLTARHSANAAHSSSNPKANRVVRLRPVEVVSYLKTRDMAVRTGTNEVTFNDFQRWAEPLADGIRRVLAENLREASGIRAVLTDQPAPASLPVYDVSVQVLACEGMETSHHGSTAFKAVWQISRDGTDRVVADGVFQAKPAAWRPGDFGQLADLMSQNLGDFSDVLVGAISK